MTDLQLEAETGKRRAGDEERVHAFAVYLQDGAANQAACRVARRQVLRRRSKRIGGDMGRCVVKGEE
jgi:hypothetical protein